MVLVLLPVLWVIVNFNSVIKLQTTLAFVGGLLVTASHCQVQALQARLLAIGPRFAAATADGCRWLIGRRLLVNNSDRVNIAFRVLVHFFVKVTLRGLKVGQLVNVVLIS